MVTKLSAVYKYDLCPSQSCSTVTEEEIAPLVDWRRAGHREGESLEETSGDWRVACTWHIVLSRQFRTDGPIQQMGM